MVGEVSMELAGQQLWQSYLLTGWAGEPSSISEIFFQTRGTEWMVARQPSCISHVFCLLQTVITSICSIESFASRSSHYVAVARLHWGLLTAILK